MPVSDDEYIEDASDDDIVAPRSRTRDDAAQNTRSQAPRKTKGTDFGVTRTWEELTEDADGTITGAVEGLREAGKRKRLLKDTTPLQRGIIRHLIIILDLSSAMGEKDLRPTRYLLTLRYTMELIHEFFEQNPISQLGLLGMRDGICVPISDLSGNPTSHITALQSLIRSGKEPSGQPSLENALEMSRASLFHAPAHTTREILLVFGALHTSDPGDIHATIRSLVRDKIRARVIGLAAQVAICAELVALTNPSSSSSSSTTKSGNENYTIVLDELHFRDLLLSITTPPVTYSTTQSTSTSSLLMMGFPSRTISANPSLCACHARPSRAGYLCSRCGTKVCSLPSECPACGLTLILSTHLARSYHHLFPLVNWREVPWDEAWRSRACAGCLKGFPEGGRAERSEAGDPRERHGYDGPSDPMSEKREIFRNGHGHGGGDARPQHLTSSRYECPFCKQHFCIDCDLFAHEVVHNCPGCQSGSGEVHLGTSLLGETEMGMSIDVDMDA